MALVVSSKKLGTAYGLMNAIQNLCVARRAAVAAGALTRGVWGRSGLAVGALGAGYLLEATNNDYHILTFTFGCCAAVSWCAAAS